MPRVFYALAQLAQSSGTAGTNVQLTVANKLRMELAPCL